MNRTTELKDKNGIEIFENNNVKFLHKGKPVICKIVFKYGMFCLQWSDGYVNKYPLDNDNLEVAK